MSVGEITADFSAILNCYYNISLKVPPQILVVDGMPPAQNEKEPSHSYQMRLKDTSPKGKTETGTLAFRV